MRYLFKLLIPTTVIILVSFSLLLLQERKLFDPSTLVHIDPIPHTKELIHQKKYAQAEEYLSYFITYNYVKKNPESHKLLATIKKRRESYEYKVKKLWEGLIKGRSDEDIGKASAIASDFMIIGDVRDLTIQGTHYLKDEKVDNTMVALSSLGLLATASTVYSLGTTTPIKTSISVLKYGKRMKKIPSWLNSKLIESAKVAQKTNSLKSVNSLLDPIFKLYEKVGLNQSLNLLKKTKNIKELKGMVKFSSRFKKKSEVLLQLTNNKAYAYAKAMPNVKPQNFLYASTYGERGLRGMKKVGEKKFIKRVGFGSNLAKTTYKGNLNSLFEYLLKKLPNSILYIMSFLGLFYFSKKAYSLIKKFL